MGYLQEATTSLVLASGTFKSVMDHTYIIERIRHDQQGTERDSVNMANLVGTHHELESFRDKAIRVGQSMRPFPKLILLTSLGLFIRLGHSYQRQELRSCYSYDKIRYLAMHYPQHISFA